MKNILIGIALALTLPLCAANAQTKDEDTYSSYLTFAERRAARQEARQAAYAQYEAAKQARIQAAVAASQRATASYGCNGGGTQMYYPAPAPTYAMPVTTGNGCCGGNPTQTYYMLPAAPVQTIQVAPPPPPPAPVQTVVPVQAPAPQTGASVNVQYYLPPPQIQGGEMQMNPPVTQAQQPCCNSAPYSGTPKKQPAKTEPKKSEAYIREEWKPLNK